MPVHVRFGDAVQRGQPIMCHAAVCCAPMQSLVDDGMVHQEKIGSSNYFW
jgi:hypothetical protein